MDGQVVTDGGVLQTLFNIAIGLLAFFGSLYVKGQNERMSELRAGNEKTSERLNAVLIEMPHSYAAKQDVKDLAEALFKKLDRIEEKLDSKADKP